MNKSSVQEAERVRYENSGNYILYSKDKINDFYKDLTAVDDVYYSLVQREDCESVYEYIIKKKKGGTEAIENTVYAIMWDDINNIYNDKLIELLLQSGGTQNEGFDKSAKNKNGIIPILLLDRAVLNKDKPDRMTLDNLTKIVNSVNASNFYQIGAEASTLTMFDRKQMVDELERLKQKDSKF